MAEITPLTASHLHFSQFLLTHPRHLQMTVLPSQDIESNTVVSPKVLLATGIQIDQHQPF